MRPGGFRSVFRGWRCPDASIRCAQAWRTRWMVRFGAIGGELAGMDDISLRFPNRHETYIEWRQHGVPMRVKVGTGGIPAVNHGCYGPAELEWLWAEGGWKAENVFACELRMLETCFAERYTFVFAGEQMTLLTESIGAQPGAQTRESGIRGIKK